MHAIAVVPLPMQLSKTTPPRIGVCQYEVAEQVNGLLSGVELAFVAMHGLLDDDGSGMLLVLVGRIDSPHLAIAGVFLHMVAVTLRMVPLTSVQCLHLRIVRRQFVVEHADVFVVPERHTVGIQEARRPYLVPNEIIPPHLPIALHEVSREHSLGEQHDSRIGLAHTAVLFPQRCEGNDRIPRTSLALTVQHAIRQVANHGIHRPVGNEFHSFEAVHVIDMVEFDVHNSFNSSITCSVFNINVSRHPRNSDIAPSFLGYGFVS